MAISGIRSVGLMIMRSTSGLSQPLLGVLLGSEGLGSSMFISDFWIPLATLDLPFDLFDFDEVLLVTDPGDDGEEEDGEDEEEPAAVDDLAGRPLRRGGAPAPDPAAGGVEPMIW